MEYFEDAWPFTDQKKVVLNQRTAAEKNRLRILGLIARRRCLSQRQLTQATGLHASTVWNIVHSLQEEGLIREAGIIEADRAGPKEIELEIIPDCMWCAGINLDTHGHRIVLVNARGHTLAQENLPPGLPTEEIVPFVCERINACATSSDLPLNRLGGVGVSVPGVVDPRNGTILLSRSLGLTSYPLRDPLEKILGRPVWVERNVTCGAYAEHNVGASRGKEAFLYFFMRTFVDYRPQIGLSIIIGEKIFQGCNYAAGEVDYYLAFGPHAQTLTTTPITSKTADTFYESLAHALAGIANLLDISCIVLACNDTHLTMERFQKLQNAIVSGLVPVPERRFELLRSGLGMDGVISGSALLALHRSMATRLNNK